MKQKKLFLQHFVRPADGGAGGHIFSKFPSWLKWVAGVLISGGGGTLGFNYMQDHVINPSGYYVEQGDAAYNKGQWERAIKNYRLAAQENQNNGEAWCSMGYAYAEQGNTEKAVDAMQHAAKLDVEEASEWLEAKNSNKQTPKKTKITTTQQPRNAAATTEKPQTSDASTQNSDDGKKNIPANTAAADEQSAAEYIAKGENALKAKNHADAVENYETAVRFKPNCKKDISKNYAKAYKKFGEYIF